MLLLKLLKRFYHQYYYGRMEDKKASFLEKFNLRLKYDCYISMRADIYFYQKVVLDKNAFISDYAILNYRSGYNYHDKNIHVGANTKIMAHAKLIPQQGFIKVGRNCSIQYGCLLYGVGGLEIGDDVRIGGLSVITPMEHIYEDPGTAIWRQGEKAEGIKIGNDVWIGNSVKILDSVKIGDGCVIGAGSVVTRSLPAFSIAVGVPAKVIKVRGVLQKELKGG